MAILLLMFSYYLFYSVIYWSGLLIDFPHIILTHDLAISFLGPLFYVYMRTIILKKKLTIRDLMLLGPFLFLLLSFGKFYILSSTEKIGVVNNNLLENYIFLPKLQDILLICFLLFFGIRSYLLVKFFKLENQNSNIRLWIKIISLLFIGIGISFLIYYLLGVTFDILTPLLDYFISLLIVLLIGIITYVAFILPEVFEGKKTKIFPGVKYEKTGLSNEISKELKLKLINCIENEKIYLNNDLTLEDISNRLNVSKNHASQVINENFGMSFNNLINKYRIDEVIKHIEEGDSDINLGDLAYKVGFNNRNSFYNAFKKFTGISPTNYIKKNIQS